MPASTTLAPCRSCPPRAFDDPRSEEESHRDGGSERPYPGTGSCGQGGDRLRGARPVIMGVVGVRRTAEWRGHGHRLRNTVGSLLALSVVTTAFSLAPSTLPAGAAPAHAAATPRVIIDTDLSLWWDDATAVGMANVLEQQGRLKLLGIMSDIRNPIAVAALNAIDTAYGHASVPLGARADSAANTAAHGYTDVLVATLPHKVRSSADVPLAVPLYRRLLAAQPDHSVTIVAIGGDSNLAGLLRSRSGEGSGLPGRALVAAKVQRLVIEDGLFPSSGSPPPFTNEKIDPAATAYVVNGRDWPTPIAWVDGTTGIATRVGGTLCQAVSAKNPMRLIYENRFGCGPPGDGDWDGPTLLYAVGNIPKAFEDLGQGGAAKIDSNGGLVWQSSDPSRLRNVYVHVADQSALNQRIDQLLVSR